MVKDHSQHRERHIKKQNQRCVRPGKRQETTATAEPKDTTEQGRKRNKAELQTKKSTSQSSKPVFRIKGSTAVTATNTEQLSGAAGRKVRGQFGEFSGRLIGNRWLMADTHLSLFQRLGKVLRPGAGHWW